MEKASHKQVTSQFWSEAESHVNDQILGPPCHNLLQKLHCFVKGKLSKTRAETYAVHLTHSLFDARRYQGRYTVYCMLCLCLSCEYFRAEVVSYPLNKQQLGA